MTGEVDWDWMLPDADYIKSHADLVVDAEVTKRNNGYSHRYIHYHDAKISITKYTTGNMYGTVSVDPNRTKGLESIRYVFKIVSYQVPILYMNLIKLSPNIVTAYHLAAQIGVFKAVASAWEKDA